ncbi:type II toxin-antitoxin system RelE/ParE family toxin [Solidesulfovibrio magneticus]|uniref:Plasmid stabilization system protein n=1 Tax=Solidesulfovibrio magneticus (strain ATCC 700980 / DSM 13731 / RS-1) TaxID=573370 RepID=C4XUN9_SOLM1|nr:type II toxin-antitoxin system RelE/ParE family toxin [Solidesulfovibrio magneticus]BAH73490.1 hypothetical protein DMR_p2_00090 [Solidesulfovibrio magneticus RS-1]
MHVKWLRTALKNLDDELEYIAREDHELAVKIYAHIQDAVDNLKQFPDSSRPGRIFGTRELVISRYNYLIPYRVREDVVEILRVFHTSRKQPIKW